MKKIQTFNGQRRPENSTILNELIKRLKSKHLIGLTTRQIAHIEPDLYPKTSAFFLTSAGFRDPNNDEFVLHDNGQPMTLEEIEDFDADIAAAIVAAAAPNAPEAELLFDGNEASRRAQYKDYIEDQKMHHRGKNEMKSQVTEFIVEINDSCDEVGREVYQAFLPTHDTIGDTVGLWNALVAAMGINAGSGLEQVFTSWQNVRLNDNVPDFFSRQREFERTMADMGHAVDPNIIKSQINKRIRYWQCPTTAPYQSTLDMLIQNPATTVEDYRSAILRKEQDLLSHWPRTSSGKRSDKDNAKLKRGGGDERVRVTHDESDEDEARYGQEAPRAFTGKCGLCKQIGHQSKQCPDGWVCDKCKWVHHKNDLCDNGAAKAAWMKALADKKASGQVLKAGGGGGPMPQRGNRK
jgi:hypothetical protein